MVAPLEMHASEFLTTPSQAPKSSLCTSYREGGGLGARLSGIP
jgi:hypothetical protein